MAEKEVLSQEEIDALLNTVEEEPPQEPVNPDPLEEQFKRSEDDVQVLNFSSQERVVRGELPVLDKIHDRATRFFANDIYQLMARDLQIKQEALAVFKHREFMSSLPNPTLMTIRRFKPLRGKALVLFDSTFVYDLVDYYFGGSSQFLAKQSRTDFTATELRVMEIITGKLVRNIEQAWAPIIKLDVIKVGDETNPQLVHIGEPNELLLVSRFNVDFGKESGTFSFVIPYSMVEPIKQQLELGAARPDDEIDPNWVMSLKEELMDVELTVSSSMAQAQSTLGKIMEWQVGDFIPVEMNEVVTLDIEGTPGFTATIGSNNDKRAVKIIKKISYRGN
ncbi:MULTISPECIES: flagellar motor switch protein FliM [unclassified Legionella]|uniref:flagellar motor switch protein FliM n=1 Tax=unclassified Legionella TaxID=2622702 RepID=UPI0010543B67|nr:MULTISPECIES: flagellar motor switch protein FliM [unclassified Legionella]MDI9817630.1 flagellar motor switch protein FliM [Legionella sp. PL877]